MDIQSVRRIVSKIKGGLFKTSNYHSTGILKTSFKGTGLQFREHQVYTPGDEVRFIDWKIMAKTSIPYIKTFEEERNVEIVVIIDASPSMLYGHNGVSKLQASVELCCLLYLLAAETKDKVHVLLAVDEIINIPKTSGELGITYLISTLQEINLIDKKGKINLDFQYKKFPTQKERSDAIGRHLHKKREIVIFSDFGDFLEVEFLKRLLYKKHIHCFQILAPLDRADALPYAVLVNEIEVSKWSYGKIKFEEKRKYVSNLGPRLKQIDVDKAYLDQFIREMI